MDVHHIEIEVRPLADWPDDRLALVYQLISGDVADLLADPEAGAVELAAARRDAELFGVEAMRRGLIA